MHINGLIAQWNEIYVLLYNLILNGNEGENALLIVTNIQPHRHLIKI